MSRLQSLPPQPTRPVVSLFIWRSSVPAFSYLRTLCEAAHRPRFWISRRSRQLPKRSMLGIPWRRECGVMRRSSKKQAADAFAKSFSKWTRSRSFTMRPPGAASAYALARHCAAIRRPAWMLGVSPMSTVSS